MSSASPRLAHYLLAVLALAVLTLFLLWPIFITLTGGFVDPHGRFTLKYFLSIFRDPLWLAGLLNSLLIAALTTLCCLLLSLPLAILSVRCRFPAKTLLTSLLLIPLILPPFVGVIGLRMILGRFGALNTLLEKLHLIAPASGIDFLGPAFPGSRLLGIVIMETLHLYPILYLNLAAALANLDPALDEAAQNLGAGTWTRLRRITLPLILPGAFAGSTIVFIWSFTELGTPLMFDFYTVTPVQIFWSINEIQTNPRAYALVLLMLAVAVTLYLLSRLTLGTHAWTSPSRASTASFEKPLKPLLGVLASLLFLSVLLAAILPHLGVIFAAFAVDGSWYRSILPTAWTFKHLQAALTHELAGQSIRNSLLYASLSTVLCLSLGFLIAYLTTRARLRLAWLLDALAMLPLAVPGLVVAFGYVAMSYHWPFAQLARFFESINLPTLASCFQITGANPNPTLFLIIAYAIRRLPYVVRSASAGLQQTPLELEEAAENLGASRLTILRKISLPLISANLIAGGILAFSFAMLEVSDSLILAQRQEHFPITKAIFELHNRLGDGPYIASAMGLWGMLLLSLTLIAASLLMGRRLGALFRV